MRDINNVVSKQMIECLSFKSIAGEDSNKVAAKWIANYMTIFMDKVEIYGESNPTIVAEMWGASEKTSLFYGHYDVQPASKSDGWKTDPFIPVVNNERIYCRGASDNKCQHFSLLLALKALKESGVRPSQTIRVILEGEEEVGSHVLIKHIATNPEIYKADSIVIVDGAASDGKVGLYSGAVGVEFFRLVVDNGHGDLHSGRFANKVQNPADVMVEIITKLKQLELPVEIDEDSERIRHNSSFNTSFIRVGSDPRKSIIPGKAESVMGFRLHPGANRQALVKKLISIFRKLDKEFGVKITFEELVTSDPVMSKTTALIDRFCQELSRQKLEVESGVLKGSLPFLPTLMKTNPESDLAIVSFGQNSDNAHGVDESYSLEKIHQATKLFKQLLVMD